MMRKRIVRVLSAAGLCFYPTNFYLVVFCILVNGLQAQDLISVKNDNIINLSGKGNAVNLIDEQSLYLEQSKSPVTVFQPDYNSLYLPADVLIDLHVNHPIDYIMLFDANGVGALEIYTGDPSEWKLVQKVTTNSYKKWMKVSLYRSTRFVLLKFINPTAVIGEVVLLGKNVRVEKKEAISQKHLSNKMNQLIGVNAFHDDPNDKLAAVAGIVREYHNWDWDEGGGDENYDIKNRQLAWSPSWIENWDFDRFYNDMKNRGVVISPCLQGSLKPLYQENSRDIKPLEPGMVASDPMAYRSHSEYLYQFTARYGKGKITSKNLLVKSNNKSQSGLGYIQYVENWNESDKWWRGREGYFTPFEFAAMCSADYDGHESTLGRTYGVKNADGSMKMVMGGLVDINMDYLNGMRIWSEFNRKSGFPADIINLHCYATDGKHGISPEQAKLKSKLKKVVDWRNLHFPDKEVWLSEFGYDINEKSIQNAPTIGKMNAEEVQGAWLIRSYLEIAAAGVNRTMAFMFRDVNAQNPNKYNSSGFTREKWNHHEPKPAYYMVAGFRKIIGEYRFYKELDSKNEDVNIYAFRSDTGKEILAVWCNTSTGKVIDNFEIPNTIRTAKLYTVQCKSSDYGISFLKANEGKIKVSISEIPIFIEIE